MVLLIYTYPYSCIMSVHVRERICIPIKNKSIINSNPIIGYNPPVNQSFIYSVIHSEVLILVKQSLKIHMMKYCALYTSLYFNSTLF